MERALTALSHLPETQEQVQHYIQLAAAEILDGHTDLMMVTRRLKAAADAIAGIQEAIKPYVLQEAAKYAARGEFTAAGATFSIAQRTTYDYKADSRWQELSKALKDHEALLKQLRGEVVSEATGEIHTPPAVKVSEYITIKKY